jgi:hypothetical protein
MWHFFALPVLVINVGVAAVQFSREPRPITAWGIVVAVALALAIFVSRSMPLRAQDRIIRFEERTRLERLLPADLRGRIDELKPSQLVALRFAPDDEVPELTRRALAGELANQSDIKRAIRNWRADHLRV